MSGFDNMKARVQWLGGVSNDGRIVSGKLRSFHKALTNSYQAEDITFNGVKWRCLINPDRLSENYDLKEISIDHEAGMEAGSIFYWDRTDTYWIVTLIRYTEESYFRARITRCTDEIELDGKRFWTYFRGPLETDTVWQQKHNIVFNKLNYSLLMYIPKNEDTLDYFSRHQVVKFDEHNWKVVATDKYSQAGIIEVYLKEYFDNEMKDNMAEPVEIVPDETAAYIDGPQVIRGYDKNITYTIKNATGGQFYIVSNNVKVVSADSASCKLTMLTGKGFTFDVVYILADNTQVTLPITVKSL